MEMERWMYVGDGTDHDRSMAKFEYGQVIVAERGATIAGGHSNPAHWLPRNAWIKLDFNVYLKEAELC